LGCFEGNDTPSQNGFQRTTCRAELRKHPLIGFDWFSDTVLLYTREDTDDHCRELCATVAWLTFETMLRSDVRVRCGVAYGEAHIDEGNGIYVGRPIVEAHELEKAQIWAGGAFTESAVNRLPQIARGGKVFDWFVVPYRVPLKMEGGATNLAVDWKGDPFRFPSSVVAFERRTNRGGLGGKQGAV
jgi:hypothetical protein